MNPLKKEKLSKAQCDDKSNGAGDWQIGCKDIKMRMVNLYYSDSWADCTFLIRREQLVSAHKVVLASASPVFAAMFYGGMPENSGPIQIDDLEPDTFLEMIRYIYTDNTDIISINDACALYYAAKKYMLLHLKTECLEYLLKNLTAEDCCLAYEFAQMFEESKLLSACEEVMKSKTKEILCSDGFLDASIETVHFIYSMNDLAIDSEADLFEALHRYVILNRQEEDPGQNTTMKEINGIENVKQNQIGDGDIPIQEKFNHQNGIADDVRSVNCYVQDKKSDVETTKNAIKEEETEDMTVRDAKAELFESLTTRHVLKLIRFLTMSAEEFINIPATSSMLTQAETIAIMTNIINHYNSEVPMPDGFSTERAKRSIQEDVLARKIIKYKFTVPECKYYKTGDTVWFPQVHGANCSWKLALSLTPIKNKYQSCIIRSYGTGPETYSFVLNMRIFNKNGDEILYDEFSCRRITPQYTIDFGHCQASFSWSELLDDYLEDGALNFEVELKPDLSED